MNMIDVLKTCRCRLLPPAYEYTSSLYQLFNNETTKRFLPDFCMLFETEEKTKLTIKSLISNISKGYGLFWCIIADDKCIGFIGIADLPHYPSIFFALHEKYRRNGYMEECISIVQEYVCGKHGVEHIYTEVEDDNVRSLRVLAKCGYVRGKKGYVYSPVQEET